MKVSIEIGHGWCAGMAKCEFCGYEFLLVRQRSQKVKECRCLCCGNQYIVATEVPWVGLLEEMVKNV